MVTHCQLLSKGEHELVFNSVCWFTLMLYFLFPAEIKHCDWVSLPLVIITGSWITSFQTRFNSSISRFASISLFFPRFSIRTYTFSVRSLILAAVCITITVIWGVYRNDDRYTYTQSAQQATSLYVLLMWAASLFFFHGFADPLVRWCASDIQNNLLFIFCANALLTAVVLWSLLMIIIIIIIMTRRRFGFRSKFT